MNRDKIPRAYDLHARREREFRKERAAREMYRTGRDEQEGFQPTMLTFKAFLQTQDDSITDEESLEKYGEYKLEFQRQQLNEFFVTHKVEEWFRERYHPLVKSVREAEMNNRLRARLAAFTFLLREDGPFCELEMEEKNAETLVELLDTCVATLEGGHTESGKGEDSSIHWADHYKTTSVFLSCLHPSITRAELESTANKFPGFLRLALSEPDPAKQFTRKCWISFQRTAKIREICFSLNSMKIREHELKPVVNKDLSKRVRSSDWANTVPRVLETSVEFCKELIEVLDRQAGLASEILLDVHLEPHRVLDRLVLYLRIVHSIDWYSQGHSLIQHITEDEMPNRMGLIHVRPSGEKEVEEEDVEKHLARLKDRTAAFLKERGQVDSEAAAKLGLKVEADEVEKFMSASMQELEKDKWICTLSKKKFKAPEYVRKHIINKFGEKIDEVKTDVEFFNNYIKDDKRPSMPLAPVGTPMQQQQEKGSLKRAAETHQMEFQDQVPAKRSIKERLGNGGVRVTHSMKDPRSIVDYSDVDSFAVLDFDF